MGQAHKYDGIGICIYCDRCNDPFCCDETFDCDMRHWKRVEKTFKDIKEGQSPWQK